MIATEEERLQIVNDVISEIQSVIHDNKWYISSDKLAELIDLPKEEFHKRLYHYRADFKYKSGIHGGFNEADGDALCSILGKILNINGMTRKFSESGIYFHESILSELRDFFVSRFSLFLEKHQTDLELLLLLSSATLNFDDAYETYLDEKLEMEDFIRRVVDAFTEGQAIDTAYSADRFLMKYLHSLLDKNVISFAKITSEHRDRLYYELYGRIRTEQKKKKKKNPSRLEFLLDFFSLDEGSDIEAVRKRYKELLKEYHPDVNRNGLEMTQKIIAYFKELSKIMNS